MVKLVMIRHGESIWNRENRFAGWTDIDLTRKGALEAANAGKKLKKKEFMFDIAYTSFLKRSIRTLWIVLDTMDIMYTPVVYDWRLNERHYGALTSLNKARMAAKFGEEQVHIWRRSYDIRPPALKENDPKNPALDKRYSFLKKSQIPRTECLKDTVERVIPFWKKEIVPKLKKGRRILISAHGNSMRAIIKHIENISDKDIADMNIPTGIPLIYEFDKSLKVRKKYYLASPLEMKKAISAVLKQGKARS
ncbi:MAG: phosphoglyceromutase [Candidatus Schekmanbacteria bacterium GWA2_38_9]|nr:MAG: phosphoglyceromutase [Candidatus Schekmanbacteria bacterium GWA2_38_9]